MANYDRYFVMFTRYFALQMLEILRCRMLRSLILICSFLSVILGSKDYTPTLQTFSLDMAYGKVSLSFSYPINASSLVINKVTLQAKKIVKDTNSTTLIFRPRGTYNDVRKQGNNTANLFFFLTSDDYALLKIQKLIGTSTSNSFITLENGTVHNINHVSNRPVNHTHGFQVTTFNPDKAPPYIEDFSLNMNSGVIVIEFSEPIDPLTFTFSGLTIQSAYDVFPTSPLDYPHSIFTPPQWPKGTDRYGHYQSLVPLGNEYTSLISIMNYNRRLIYQLGHTNLNNIKAPGDLCTSSDNCYISAYIPFVNDTSGNRISLAGFETINGLKLSNYTADVSPPILESWRMDLNNGSMTLYFSETIMAGHGDGYFNYTCIVLSGTPIFNPLNYIRIQNPGLVSSGNTPNVTFFLSTSQFDWIKSNPNIGKTTSNTYVILDAGTTSDVSFTRNIYTGLESATYINALKVTELSPDIQKPYLQSLILDMSKQEMILIFSELVKLKSFNLSAITFQSDSITATDTEWLVIYPDFMKIVTKVNSHNITLALTYSGFCELKLRYNSLARSIDTSYISYPETLISDVGGYPIGNPVEPVSSGFGFRVSEYVPDLIPPTLLSWSIDMSLDILTMIFSEPLDVTSIDLTRVQFQSDKIMTVISHKSKLSVSSTMATGSACGFLNIHLSPDDAASLKSQAPLCVVETHCYLTLADGFGYDISSYNSTGMIVHNPVIPVYTPLGSTSFIRDTLPPALVSFNLDMNSRVLQMTFSKPVLGQFLKHSGLLLVNGPNSPHFSFIPSKYSFSLTATSSIVKFMLCDYDFHLLEGISILATTASNTYLAIQNDTVQDTVGNSIIGFGTNISNTYIGLKPVTTLIINKVIPYISAIRINRKTFVLTIAFNVDIRTGYMKQANFFLTDGGRARNMVSLYNANKISTAGKTSVLQYNITNIWGELQSLGIGSTPSTTMIYVNTDKSFVGASSAIVPNKKMSYNYPIKEGGNINMFRLDLSYGKLLLDLAIPVTSVTVSIISFTLQNYVTSTTYTLTSAKNITLALEGYLIDIELTFVDLCAIQSLVLLFEKPTDLFLTLPAKAISDQDSVPLSGLLSVPCQAVVLDIVRPTLNSFVLDLSAKTLTLIFSEPVIYSSMSLQYVFMANQMVNASIAIPLNTSTITSSGLATANLVLNIEAGSYPSDRDRIHLTKSIGTTISSTYIYASTNAFTDTGHPPNFLIPILRKSALESMKLIPDLKVPNILYFDVDMSQRTVSIVFDEAVNFTSSRPSFYTLWAAAGKNSAPNVNLATSTIYIPNNGPYGRAGRKMTILISDIDFSAIMLYAPYLCTLTTNCYMALRQGASRDISPAANPVPETLALYATNVNALIVDTTPPNMLHYNVSMRDGTATFYFDKYIQCAASNTSLIHFQYAEFSGNTAYQVSLTESSYPDCTSGAYSKVILIQFGTFDFDHIKATALLMKTKSNTYLRLFEGAFVDVFGNSVLEIIDGRAMHVNGFIADNIRPILQGFTVMNDGILNLYFDEPVDVSTFQASGFTFQEKINIHQSNYTHTLSFAKVHSHDLLHKAIKIDLQQDFYTISQGSKVFSVQSMTYLWAMSTAIQDTSGNALINISSTFALIMGPSIMHWDLDRNLGKVTLYFSERVATAFPPNGLTLQNLVTAPTKSLTIDSTRNTFIYDSLSNSYSVLLSRKDLNRIKFFHVATSQLTWLSCPPKISTSVILSTSVPALYTAPISSNLALLMSKFTPDITSPVLLLGTLDFGNNILELVFDEPVLVNQFVVHGVTLLSLEIGNSITLSSSQGIELFNLTTVSINLTKSDENYIKISYTLKSPLNRILLKKSSAKDFSGNYYLGNDEKSYVPLVIRPDKYPPFLIAFDWNLQKRIITLTFNEVIKLNLLHPEYIHLYSSQNNLIYSINNFTFSNYSLLSTSPVNGNIIIIDYGSQEIDSNNLLNIYPLLLGQSLNTTFITIDTIYDVFGNKAILSQPFECTSIIPDTSSLLLLSYEYWPISSISSSSSNINIILHFSKIILLSSFSCADFIFINSQNSLTETIILQNIDCIIISTSDSKSIQIQIPTVLSTTTSIGKSISTTYLSTSTSCVTTDIQGNILTSTPISEALKTGVKLLKYNINMNTGNIIFIFSSLVKHDISANISCIGFHSITSGNNIYFQNTSIFNGFTSQSPSVDFIISLSLSMIDLNNLKALDVSNGDVYLLLHECAFLDSHSLPILPVQQSDAMLPNTFVADNVPPVLQTVALDMSNEILTLTFNEPIRLSSVNPNNIRIQSAKTDANISRVLYSGGAVSISQNTVYIALALYDSAYIKLNPMLAKDINTSFISYGLDTASDMSGNAAAVHPYYNAVSVSKYINDTKRPNIDVFGIDMRTGLISLNFSEPVLVPHTNLTDIIIQSRYLASQGFHLRLTGGHILTPSNWSMTIQLSATDLIQIKNTSRLCRTRQLSYITFPKEFTMDTSKNPIFPIIDGTALLCSKYGKNTINPTVNKISLDMNNGVILFYVSEIVDISTVSVPELTIHSQSSTVTPGAISYTISRASVVTTKTAFSSIVNITLTSEDLTIIKSQYPLATSVSTTFFSWTSAFFSDVFGNTVVSVQPTVSQAVTIYIINKIPPSLLSYSLNMNINLIELAFSEAVLATSINLNDFHIQNIMTNRFGVSTTLGNSSSSVGKLSDGGVVQIIIDSVTMNHMKYNQIGYNSTSSYVWWGQVFLSDTSGNYVPPQWDASIYQYLPISPTVFVADIMPPNLHHWMLDRSKAELRMTFDEPILFSSLDAIMIYFDKPSDLLNGTVIPTEAHKVPIVRYETDGTVAVISLNYTCFVNLTQTAFIDSMTVTKFDTCPSNSFLGVVYSTSKPLYLGLMYGAFVDISAQRNYNVPMSIDEVLRESGPDCSVCPIGYYISRNCTSNSDRVCSLCSTCAPGRWIREECSAYHDTRCLDCTPCSYGYTTDVACGQRHDTVCRQCSICNEYQYEAATCTTAHDIVCNSCLVCAFKTKTQEATCVMGKYYWWAQQNCCRDSDGNKVLCADVNQADMQISTVNGRHHWVFPSNAFPVQGYSVRDNF